MKDNNIQRYQFCPDCGSVDIFRERRPNGNDRCGDCNHIWPSKESFYHIREKDHIKAIKEQNDEITFLKKSRFGRDEIIQAQAKEIERLKNMFSDTWCAGRTAIITDCFNGHKFKKGDQVTLIERVDECESWICEDSGGDRWCVFPNEAELTK